VLVLLHAHTCVLVLLHAHTCVLVLLHAHTCVLVFWVFLQPRRVSRSTWRLRLQRAVRRVEPKPSGSPASARGTRSRTPRECVCVCAHTKTHTLWSLLLASVWAIIMNKQNASMCFCFAETPLWRRRWWVKSCSSTCCVCVCVGGGVHIRVRVIMAWLTGVSQVYSGTSNNRFWDTLAVCVPPPVCVCVYRIRPWKSTMRDSSSELTAHTMISFLFMLACVSAQYLITFFLRVNFLDLIIVL